ncbi:MAG: hypothetical protein NVSMB32_13040 [Actinomycetota bacterium]
MLGIPRNPLAPNVAEALAAAAHSRGLGYRVIDLPTIGVSCGPAALAAKDRDGPIQVTHVAPYLLYWQPAAVPALLALAQLGARLLNPVAASLAADDKSQTAVVLRGASVAQLPSIVCPQEFAQVVAAARDLGYPIVAKRASGAQGRWVRRARDTAQLREAFDELVAEGPGSLLVQTLVEESEGKAIRAVITGGRLLVATLRSAPPGEWRSNVAQGGTQEPVGLSPQEAAMAVGAAQALGLGHAGVDLLQTSAGTIVLEVNACPDFTSMSGCTDEDLAAAVIDATLTC